MTDKEKQIEEIARIIHFDYWGACDADSCSDCPHSDFNICNDEIIAEKLYDKLFPEGSVVLSREEYAKDFCSQFNKGYERGSKETAREIFNKIKIKVLTEDMSEDRPQTLYRFTSFDIMKMAREIVEELGVVFENGRATIKE